MSLNNIDCGWIETAQHVALDPRRQKTSGEWGEVAKL
jgi:hypothetical protein